MALDDMQVYQTEIHGTTIELVGQMIEKFNAASGGSIVLNSDAWGGDYSKESFYNVLAAAQRRVNRNGANGSASSTALSQGEEVGVKVAGGFGPVVFEPSQMTWLQRSPAEAIMAISEGFANALLQDQLNTAIAAGVAAVENQAAATNDVSATAGLTYTAINGSHAKFGDASGLLIADVMTGAAYHKLIDFNLANSNRLFESTGVRVIDILGKIAVVSDIPALYAAGTPNKSKVLSVTASGIIVDNSSDIVTNMQTNNGGTRIETTWQADYSFGLKLKGYQWDVTNGGSSPTDAALATGSNWDLAKADIKHTLGTIAVTDADA